MSGDHAAPRVQCRPPRPRRRQTLPCPHHQPQKECMCDECQGAKPVVTHTHVEGGVPRSWQSLIHQFSKVEQEKLLCAGGEYTRSFRKSIVHMSRVLVEQHRREVSGIILTISFRI